MIIESAPPSLRGQLSKWMLEPKSGVFVGNISAAVRDRLWEKACREVSEGGVTLIYNTNNEQGYAVRSYGDTTRQIEEWEGLFLVRRPNAPEPTPGGDGSNGPESDPDWPSMVHPAIWAKTSRGITLEPGEPNWHPLFCHMIDVAMVALRLWQYLLPPAIKNQMQESLGVATQAEAGRWIAFFIGLHDLGKANPGFAFRWEEGADRLMDHGFKPGKSAESSPHGFVTAQALTEMLPTMGLDMESAAAVGHALGGHHGVFPSPTEMERVKERMGGRRWQQARTDLMRLMAHVLQVDHLPAPDGNLLSDTPFLILLAGMTSVADWIGSNHQYFPFAGDTVTLPRYPRRSRWLALRALIDLGWFHRPGPVEPVPFSELFDFAPNRLQERLAEVAADLHGPSLVLVEYPMGGGKTEGSLYIANALQAQSGQQGLYIALPTMATSNQMFDRVTNYLANRFPDQRINLQLLHGRADLNPSFARLLHKRSQRPDPPVVEDETDPTGRLVAAEWFTHRKQSLLSPFGVGTVDQLLLAALDTRHFFVRLFGLAGKVVVIDEAHAYDTYMQTLLCHLLTWMAACGSSVVLLSATLPSRTRTELLAAYAAGRGWARSLPDQSETYPRVTWLTEGQAKANHIDGAAHRRVRLLGVQGVQWMVDLKERLAGGGCAAVLCTTVTRAQDTYLALLDLFPKEELLLFHARYPFDDRMEREGAVLELFGKGGESRPFRMVCVATQVIEQSLDIDFDLMVSELAPVDLVLQRSGRIGRHARRERPTHLAEPELWLLLPPSSAEGVPLFDRSATRVYDSHLLLRSYLVLRECAELTIPEGVEELIEAVYNPVPPPEEISSSLSTYWVESAKRWTAGAQQHRRKAVVSEIPGIHTELIDWHVMALDDESEEIHESHRAMTRLGGPSVEVICLCERDGLIYLNPDAAEPFSVNKRPDRAGILLLLGRSLRLSFDPGLVKQILELPVPPEWEVTAHLRRHRLLRFAPDGTCLTADLPLHLDPVLGLRKRTLEEEEM